MAQTSLVERTEPRLLTVGQIAAKLSIPFHRVRYILKSRKIRPAAWSGNARVFNRDAVAHVRTALNGIEARRCATHDDCPLFYETGDAE